MQKKYPILDFDVNTDRIDELSKDEDRAREANLEELKAIRLSKGDNSLIFSSNIEALRGFNVFIVTVTTPIDQFNDPDLGTLFNASNILTKILKKNDIVIYESTVLSGSTEEDCIPVLEKYSGLYMNVDFLCGYSPERINQVDKTKLTKVKKVTSGSMPEIATLVDNLYGSVIEAFTHKATSINVAEASKAIENAQPEVNISFVNELTLIFDRVGIATTNVIEAVGTK